MDDDAIGRTVTRNKRTRAEQYADSARAQRVAQRRSAQPQSWKWVNRPVENCELRAQPRRIEATAPGAKHAGAGIAGIIVGSSARSRARRRRRGGTAAPRSRAREVRFPPDWRPERGHRGRSESCQQRSWSSRGWLNVAIVFDRIQSQPVFLPYAGQRSCPRYPFSRGFFCGQGHLVPISN